MRYDTPIFFRVRGEAIYNESTGDYVDAQPTDTRVMASVHDTRTETLQMVYGALKKGIYTIQLQNAYEEPYDLIVINGKEYRVDFERKLFHKHAMVVSEVQ